MSCRKLLTVIALLGMMIFVVTQAKPMDLYDEMSDLLDDMDVEEVVAPKSARMQPENFCKMPARKGVCRALIPRWSYDPTTKECREFKFGGCDGNPNNFASFKQCMQTCKGY